jgi:hypothetical protein
MMQACHAARQTAQTPSLPNLQPWCSAFIVTARRALKLDPVLFECTLRRIQNFPTVTKSYANAPFIAV